MHHRGATIDLLSIVEAAYRVGLDEREWLAGIAAAALEPCGRGRGFAFALRAPSRPEPRVGSAGLEGDRLAYRLESGDRLDEVVLAEAADPELARVVLAVPAEVRANASRKHRHRVSRVAAHLATADRVRRRLPADFARDPFADAEAILSTDGRVVQARGAARDERARRLLADATRSMEWARGATRRFDLDAAIAAWRPLHGGRWTLLEQYDAQGGRCVIARANAPELPRADHLSPREIQVRRCQEAGLNPDAVAYLLGLSASTVRTLVRRISAKDRPAVG